MQTTAPRVSLSITFSQFRAHLFDITMSLEQATAGQRLSLPVWTPGSYMVREFAQHIVSVRAYEGEREIAVTKIDKNTFELGNSSSSVSIHYEVYGFDSSIRAAFIDENQAFFNGCALFFRAHGFEDAECHLKLVRPTDEKCALWQVATGMAKVDVDAHGFGTYRAADYDELVDCPFQISHMKRLSFVAKDIPHEIVLVGDSRPFHEKRLVADLERLCTFHVELFGEAPFSSYTFIARFEEAGYGGLEHRCSSMLLASPYGLPQDDKEPNANYRTFLGLCSHEYFHAWNVKRLKPKEFIPFDYDRECYTSLLWIFEGITSYYDDLALRRAGLISHASYLDLMAKSYGKLLRNRGRFKQTLAASSFDAWIKFYRPNENSQNVATSYYLKGSFIGLYLDLLIRERSNGVTSLDDVMRVAYKKFGEEGLSEDEFLHLLETIGGIDSGDFKKRFIEGTDDLPLAELFSPLGIHMEIGADEFTIDDKTKMQAYVGLRFRLDDNNRAIITHVEQDGPAMKAGLSAFDEIVAINDIRIDGTNAADLLFTIRANEDVRVVYAHKRMVRSTLVRAQTLPLLHCKLVQKTNLSQHEKERMVKWLG